MGMSNASASLDATASRLSKAAAALSSPDQSGDTVQLSDEMVALLQARTAFQANVQTAKIMDDVQKSTLSIIG